jgi:hypothetical protein
MGPQVANALQAVPRFGDLVLPWHDELVELSLYFCLAALVLRLANVTIDEEVTQVP